MKTKKFYILLICVMFFYSLIFNIVFICEINSYKKNENIFINNVLSALYEKYPNLTKNDIQKIFPLENADKDYLIEYGINLDNDFTLKNNTKKYQTYLIINNIVVAIAFISILIVIIKDNKMQNMKIKEITSLIEKINKQIYNLTIEDNDESTLSILKNEIYKTTIMLKTNAENSLKDKIIIKKYIEDISHQLKTPLTVISISLENLIDNPKMDETNRNNFILKINKEVNNINYLIQNLLKLSKFDVNAVKYNNKNVSIKKIIDNVYDKISILCDLKNIEIKINYINVFDLYCDESWQTEAITNIVKNAIENSKEYDKVIINIDDNKVYSLVEIINNGEILESDINKIFERFYTGNIYKENSTGIGLSLAKSIVEKNNGKIYVNQDSGKVIFQIKYFK